MTTIIILITGGLIGILLKEIEIFQKIIYLLTGTVADIIGILYLWFLNNKIEELLDLMENNND